MFAFVKRLAGRAARGRDERDDSAAAWEGRAAKLLADGGLEILERNFRVRRGEVDIIARDGAEFVFVEVKARRSREFGGAEYAIDRRKIDRITLAAGEWLARRGALTAPCRFDAVLIFTGSEPAEFTHIRDAFQARPR